MCVVFRTSFALATRVCQHTVIAVGKDFDKYFFFVHGAGAGVEFDITLDMFDNTPLRIYWNAGQMEYYSHTLDYKEVVGF